MKTLYLDCHMGAAGDMLTAALLELLPDPEAMIGDLNRLGIPHVQWVRESSVKCGIAGTRVHVLIDGEEEDHHEHPHEHSHHHSSLSDIETIIAGMELPDNVRKDILAVYQLIADAESQVHGMPVPDIHFHEVGTLDAVADVTAVCLLLHQLGIQRILASPICVGSGQVKCAHGILPVPAPATALILKGIPIYSGEIREELCTPTGAALLKHFVNEFGEMPVMTTTAIGYGMGSKDLGAANCVRAMLGETKDSTDEVLELSCNVDDMTAEEISFAMDRLFDAGAREVYTIPIGMKKSRPGTLIRAICTQSMKDQVIRAMFQHTSTIGIRETSTRRYILDRHVDVIHTACGDVRYKISTGYGTEQRKLEFEDLQRIAVEQNMTLEEVRNLCNTPPTETSI